MAFIKSTESTKSKEPTYEVIEHFGTIGKRSGDWQIELRLISWNGNEPKYDIRPWKDSEDGEKCGKGITLSGDEMENLLNLLTKMAE